jgi:hypothetical protein
MNNNFQEILSDTGEVFIDSMLKDDLIKEIPILGISLKLLRGIQSLRDKFYLNKIRKFVETIGPIDEKKKQKLIDESKKDEERRAKFGEAVFTTLEQSESIVKVEYLAIAFEAFLNNEIDVYDLRLICHMIRVSFIDELIDVVEDQNKLELKYMVASGLADVNYPTLRMSTESAEPEYEISLVASKLKTAWQKYKKK